VSGRARGRFDVVFAFKDGYVRYTSDKTRSLPAAEVVKQLREFFRYIDKGIAAAKRNARSNGKIRRKDLEAL
jgi:hypothetical protein